MRISLTAIDLCNNELKCNSLYQDTLCSTRPRNHGLYEVFIAESFFEKLRGRLNNHEITRIYGTRRCINGPLS